jgi:hypothetical protein
MMLSPVQRGLRSRLIATVCLLLAATSAYAAKGDCGQPTSNGAIPKSSDALTILKAAVGQNTSCDSSPCVCDVDGSGAIRVTDGLRTLKAAVGQDVELECECFTSTVSTTSSSTTSTTKTTTTTLVAGCFVATELTVIDKCTGLEWERKTDDNHSDWYSWSSSGLASDGTIFTEFLPSLNTPPCFAGHCDWRLPTVAGLPTQPTGKSPELESIADCVMEPSCGDPLFGPTAILPYWSSVTYSYYPQAAWTWIYGAVGPFIKTTSSGGARAVREH